MRIPVDDPRQVGLERTLGIRTRRHSFFMERFPKQENAACKSGHHQWDREHPLNIAGKLAVMCRQCGRQVFLDVLDHTLGKNEHRTAFKERNALFEQRQLLLRRKILDTMQRR